MEITSTTTATQTAAAPAAATAKTPISSDFETFLLMLTTQMQNQDPLNPIESADFAVQLATFSGVEQQVKTNDLLQSLAQQMGIMGMSQLAGWVGMEAQPDYLGTGVSGWR
jgi:flagellar basal-body rod modification protein FlgD